MHRSAPGMRALLGMGRYEPFAWYRGQYGTRNVALKSYQQHIAFSGPCFPLRFLVQPESWSRLREDMAGFSDSAIFHRLMDLCWTFNEAEVIALLTEEEKAVLAEFNDLYKSLHWRPIEAHPHISEVADRDLQKLITPAARLLELIERRTRPPLLKRWWRKIDSLFKHE
jgi:hypothetical protein